MALETQIEDFLAAAQNRAPNTRNAYRRDLREFARHLTELGVSEWRNIDLHTVRHYIAERHRQGQHGRSLARALSALRGLFVYLAGRGLIDGNPAHGIRAPRAERRLPRALDVDQMTKLLEGHGQSTLDVRDAAMWELLYSSGLRVSELTGLELGDVDYANAEARVTGKGNKQRVVPIGRLALAALKAWLKLRGEFAAPDQRALFVSRRGTRLSTRNVQLRLRAWAARHGIDEGVHPHMLRHAFASHMLESSGDLRAVQELLGHANISTTQIYTHLDFQHLAKVYDQAHPRARKRRG